VCVFRILSSFVVTSSSSAELVSDPNSTWSDLKSFPMGDVRSEENNHYYYYYYIVLQLSRVGGIKRFVVPCIHVIIIL